MKWFVELCAEHPPFLILIYMVVIWLLCDLTTIIYHFTQGACK
jgi:hypothetical protein